MLNSKCFSNLIRAIFNWLTLDKNTKRFSCNELSKLSCKEMDLSDFRPTNVAFVMFAILFPSIFSFRSCRNKKDESLRK